MLDNPNWSNRLNCYVNKHGDPIIYTDGSCRYNGKPYAISGIGVWISDRQGYKYVTYCMSKQLIKYFKYYPIF